MLRTTYGRCPDCGESVKVTVTPGKPGVVAPHGCRIRHCDHHECSVKGLPEVMHHLEEADAWLCPNHALVFEVKNLVALYGQGYADWTAIAELLDDALPKILQKIEPTK